MLPEQKSPHPWSADALFSKAQRYAEVMLVHKGDWQFGFWSTMLLEILARAALAKASPALLADCSRDWKHLQFALSAQPGTVTTPLEPPQKKKPKQRKGITQSKDYAPRSIDISDVVKRISHIYPGFTSDMGDFCAVHFERRNAEVHSSVLAFEGLKPAEWMASYYSVCKFLSSELGASLETLFGAEEAALAEAQISAQETGLAADMRAQLKTHKALWKKLPTATKKTRAAQAEVAASRHVGHRVVCPACGNHALVHGRASGTDFRFVDDDSSTIVIQQPMLPSSFECTACGLKVNGHARLFAVGLGEAFVSTTERGAAEYFDLVDPDETYGGIEEDFNEY